MARGRHARPSGLLARLFPGRAARRRAETARERALLRELHYEVVRLRRLGAEQAGEAARAGVRARRAEEQAQAAHEAAQLLRTEVARMREELLWAWAEGRLPAAPIAPSAKVIDLREASAR